MSSLPKIRKALSDVIEGYCLDELNMYQNVPDRINTPGVIVKPHTAKFLGAMARADDLWRFDVYVVVSRTDTESAQENLDEYLASTGPNSIRQAIFETPDLGLGDCQADVVGLTEYGGEYRAARTDYMGAILRVEVHTDGSVN